MQALPDMGQALITVVKLKKKSKGALDHSNQPCLSIFTSSDRDEANWETSSHVTWESWKPGCMKLLTDTSLTFWLNADSKIALNRNGKPTVMPTPEHHHTAEIMSNSLQVVVKDSVCVSVQAAINEYSAAFTDTADDDCCTSMICIIFQALLEHQTKAAESCQHKFMTECAVDSANHCMHIQ